MNLDGQFILDTSFTPGGTAAYEPPPNQPYYADDSATVYSGDCLDVLKTLADNSVDAVVTDPPYGLEFMGKAWDSFKANGHFAGGGPTGFSDGSERIPAPRFTAGVPFQSWCQQWASECLRVLKPGGHMLAFGGTRTWHRLACAVEDAGFEIRDSIAWLTGSGFPKSLDVSKAIDKAAGAEREILGQAKRTGKESGTYGAFAGDNIITAPATDAAKQWQGYGTALKPSHEPIVVARKPLQGGTVAANVQAWGTGALNVDGCRVGTDTVKLNSYKSVGAHGAISHGHGGGEGHAGETYETRESAGRWPANVVLDGDMADELDKQSAGTRAAESSRTGTFDRGGGIWGHGAERAQPNHNGDAGASRFFPTFRYTAKAPGTERPTADGVSHPTVKPLDLMRWLIRLVTPPGGAVLDPFAGSGTTGEAAIHEHKRAILIEREPTYLPIIVRRLHKPMQIGFNFDPDDEELW